MHRVQRDAQDATRIQLQAELPEELDAILQCINKSIHLTLCVVDIQRRAGRGRDTEMTVKRLQDARENKAGE